MASTPYNPYGPPKKSPAPSPKPPPAPSPKPLPPPSSGSSPAPKYGPKTPLPPPKQKPGFTPREFLYPSKNNVYDGLIMTSGILLSTFLIKQIKKDMAPQITSKSATSLALVIILSDYLVDLGKRYRYIPYSIM